MSRSSYRRLLFIVLLSLIAGFLPTAPHAVADARLSAPPIAPTQSLLPPPASAQSTSLPASAVSGFRQLFGSQQTLSAVYDGEFNTPRTLVASPPDILNLSYAAPTYWTSTVTQTFTIAPGWHDSIEFDMNISTSFASPAARVDSFIAFRPAGSTDWNNSIEVAGTDWQTGPVSLNSPNHRLTIGGINNPQVPLEVMVTCVGGSNYSDDAGHTNVSCNWTNFHTYNDAPSWHQEIIHNYGELNFAGNAVNWGAYAGSHNGITAQNGPFLGFDVLPPLGMGAYANLTVSSPAVLLPANSTITMTLQWSYAQHVAATGGGVAVSFWVPTPQVPDGYQNVAYTFLNTPSTSTGWTTTTLTFSSNWLPSTVPLYGWVRISMRDSTPQSTWGFDSVHIYANGHALPSDQLAGKCFCDLASSVHKIFGDPVNTFSGSSYLQAEDLAVASGGPALAFDRSYVGMFADTTKYPLTALGPGWRPAWSDALTLPSQPDGEPYTVIYEAPTGNRLRFYMDEQGGTPDQYGVSDGDGILDPAPGVRAQLHRETDGTYTLTSQSQRVLRFDTAGRLSEQRDAQGHRQTFSYTGNLLQTVTDVATSRSLAFTYNTTTPPQLKTVTGPLGQVTYTYTTNGDLWKVTDLRGGVTVYGYDGTTHHLTTITDPNGVTQLTQHYDSQGRVDTQTDATGLTTTFSYATTAQGQDTTITQRFNNQVVDTAIDHYRTDGTLEYQEHNGQFVGYTTYDGNANPNVQVDGNGHATQIQNTNVGLPSQITDAVGQTTNLSYDRSNHPVQLSGTSNVTTKLSYDVSGNLTQLQNSGTTGLAATTIYTPTADNRLAATAAPDGVITQYAYDSRGQVTSTTVGTASAITTNYSYDSAGRVITTTLGVGTSLQRQEVTHYNADNTVSETINNYHDGVFDAAHPDEDARTRYGYDLLGRVIWTQDALGRYAATHYNSAQQVDWTTRNLTPFQLDASGQPVAQSFSPTQPDANVTTRYIYDSLGRLSQTTQTGLLQGSITLQADGTPRWSQAAERTTRIEYDTASRPVTTTLNYQAVQPVDTLADVNVRMITYYDGAGHPIWQRDGLGRWTKTAYDNAGRLTTTTVNYENGNPQTVDPANTSWTDGSDTDVITSTTYDTAGRVAQVTENYVDGQWTASDPLTDRSTIYGYDSLNRVITTTFNAVSSPPAGHPELNRTTTTAYGATTGRVLGTQDPLGRWLSYQYDALGRISTTVQNCVNGQNTPVVQGCAAFSTSTPDRNVPTTTHYDALGRAFETVDALSHVTHLDFDGRDRTIDQIENYISGGATNADTNVVTRASYDALGRVISTADAASKTTSYGYNGLDQPTTMTDPVGRVSSTGYDGTGVVRWSQHPDTTNPARRLTVMTPDGLGRISTTIQAYQDGVVGVSEPSDQDLITSTSYDAAGRHIQVVDPAGFVTTYGYTLLDGLAAVQQNVQSSGCTVAPCNVLTHYQYDRSGNRTKIIDARSNTRTFTYDAADEQLSANDSVHPATTWTYDAGGRTLTRSDGRGSAFTLTYGYDQLDHLKSRSAPNLSTPITAQYNALGWRMSLTDATGTTSFTYDNLGRMTQATAPTTGAVGYTYYATGLRQQLTYPSGTALQYTYADDHQMQTVATGSTTLATYSYDDAGRLKQVARNNGATSTYAYDRADRLKDLQTKVSSTQTAHFVYTLDRLGQRSTAAETLGSQSRNITYGYDGLHRLSTATESPGTSFGYSYDLVGNRTQVTTNGSVTESRTYDAANQVVGWQYDQVGNLLSDGTTSNTFDVLNRVFTTTSGTAQRTNSYNGDSVLVSQTANGTLTSYSQDLAASLPQILQTTQGSTTLKYYYGLERLAQQASLRSWYQTDGIGSVRQMLGPVGGIQSSINYDPWGTLEGGATPPTFGFAGELQDTGTGLINLRARWYQPSHGTLTSRDPFAGNVETPASLHPYQYGYDDPALFTDPSGNWPELPCITSWVPVVGQANCQGVISPQTALKAVASVGGTALGVGVCVTTALVGCVVGGAVASAAVSYDNQIIDNAFAHRPSPLTSVNRQQIAVAALSGGVFGLVGGLGGQAVGAVCKSGPWCAYAAGAATGGLGGMASRFMQNVFDKSCTDPWDGVLQEGILDSAVGALIGRLAYGLRSSLNQPSIPSPASSTELESYLFRGTSEGFPGNPGLQRAGITPTSTDPVVATVFATESANFGRGVVHIASPSDLAGIELGEPNVRASLEKEVPVNVPPTEFAARAGLTISAQEARAILSRIGVELPTRIASDGSSTQVLEETLRLNKDQILEFVRQAGGLR